MVKVFMIGIAILVFALAYWNFKCIMAAIKESEKLSDMLDNGAVMNEKPIEPAKEVER